MTRRTHPRNLRLLGETGGAPHVAEPGPLATDTRLLEQPIRLNRKAAPVAHTLPPPSDSERGARRSLRSRWLPKVYLAPVSDGTKLLLVLLAESMREDGYVSVPRDELARRLGRHKANVSARLKEAVEARLLDRVVAGHKGTTAVYRALIPNAQSVADGGDAKAPKGTRQRDAIDPGNRDAMPAQSVADGGDATTKSRTTNAARSAAAVVTPTSALPSLPAVDPTEEQERHEAEPGGRRISLRLVVAQECSHGDPHPELCVLCERERRQAS